MKDVQERRNKVAPAIGLGEVKQGPGVACCRLGGARPKASLF